MSTDLPAEVSISNGAHPGHRASKIMYVKMDEDDGTGSFNFLESVHEIPGAIKAVEQEFASHNRI
jgi:hypothetical protein